MAQLLFTLFVVFLLLSTIVIVVSNNVVRAAFGLMGCFIAIAGIYFLLSANFVALTQIMIYTGGILLLLLFGIMLSQTELPDNSKTEKKEINLYKWTISLGFIACLVALVPVFNAWNIDAVQGSSNLFAVEEIGISLLSTYLLPFELISIYLLLALIGATHLLRTKTISLRKIWNY